MRLFLVTEPRLYRDALARALTDEAWLEVVGASGWEVDTASRIDEAGADVVLVDLSRDGALRLVEELAGAVDGPGVIGLAAPETDSDVIACVEAGVSAFLPPDCSFVELLAALARAGRGESVLSPAVATTLIRRVRAFANAQPVHDGVQLTAREREILRLVDHGLTNKQIAQRLSIEVSTVKNHIHHILVKLDVGRRADAAAKARAGRSALFVRARD